MNRTWIRIPTTLALWLGAATLLMFATAPDVHAQTPAVQVAAGGYHTCAILVTGMVKCWGNNTYGQLGLGDTNNRGDVSGEMGNALPPIYLDHRGPFIQLALGGYHSCALDGLGTVFCWGNNAYGQLGSGSTNNRGDNPFEMGSNTPASGFNVQKITAGTYHTCALKFDGTVLCWGYNGYGQLGTGDTQNRLDGVNNHSAVPNLGAGRRAIDVAAAAFSTCALLDNQTVKCWGYNGAGTLGLGDTATRGDQPGEMGDALPVVNTGFTALNQLSAGGYHVCATDGGNTSGSAKCWGYNVYGQLGQGDTATRGDNPGELGSALPRIETYGGMNWRLAAGMYHTCLPAASGYVGRLSIKCFGFNGNGQLGQGDTVNRGDDPGEIALTLPPRVDLGFDPGTPFPKAVIGMAAGFHHTCALVSAGEIKCWGYNAYGQLGLGDTDSRGDNPGEMGDALSSVDL